MRRLFFALAGLMLATKPGVEELHRAALAGDLKQVELLIAGGTPVNGREFAGRLRLCTMPHGRARSRSSNI